MKTYRSTLLLATAMAAALVAGCNRPDDSRTAGQKLDSAVASTEQAMNNARTDARQATREAGQAVSRTANDIGITTKITAELAKDPDLSALRIDVDTRDGHVSLSGKAPSESARERAARLASAVEGVVAVDNHLTVESKS